MRSYELMFIVHPDVEESAFNELVEKVNGWIKDSGGEVEKVDLWGKRKMAYPIQKQNEGQYVLMNMQLEPDFCSDIEHNLGLQETVMRFLLTAVEE
ncbi:MAG: 30S ribosomal protein S6 [Anaerolineales bacterium]|jgi:small subunit ribosomal protein S6|nr:30S ribosomal protein S6 [Anaerolineales bacterium]